MLRFAILTFLYKQLSAKAFVQVLIIVLYAAMCCSIGESREIEGTSSICADSWHVQFNSDIALA
jgi:hypothetical protein